MTTASSDFADFIAGRDAVGQAYITGDAGPLSDVSTHRDPATFFPPGGSYVQGATDVLDTNRRGAENFEPGGTTRFEILHSASDGDLGYLVAIQHAEVRMQGNDDRTPMHLRITEIYRRENGDWKLVHRHADPNAEPE